MFPAKNNGTHFTAILVIMDGFSGYLTVHLLKRKDTSTINPLMKAYVRWAEQQAGRSVMEIVERQWKLRAGVPHLQVHAILTDQGGEFVNGEIDSWYQSQGIEHIKVGPNSSHMNPVGRQHQSLGNMAKTMLRHAALPKMFWPDAMEYAVYLKNRIYNRIFGCTPFEKMFGTKPDIHHVRTFESL